MNIIAAVDKNWAIGNKGKLLTSIPEDMKFFRETTTGKVVVMGRKTMQSLPGAAPLKGRTNLVLSKDKNFKCKDAMVCNSLEAALEFLKDYNPEDIYIIGGESIYRQFLPYCQTAHITYMDYTYIGDTYFPSLDKDADWKLLEESDEKTYFNLIFQFRKYGRIS